MFSLIQQSLHKLGGLFISLVTRPRLINPQLLLQEQSKSQPVYFVLETDRLSHKLLLKNLLRKQKRYISDEQILLADSGGLAPLRETLIDLINTQQSNDSLNTLLVPVAIFHGRLPGREDSWLNLLYAETWHKAGPLGSMLQLLINGRQTLVRIDEPLKLKQLMDDGDSCDTVARKASRVLRTHFSFVRRSIIGPDLSHRRTLISLVLNNPQVQQAIDEQAAERGKSRHRIERHCVKTLDKIAANFSPITARLLDPLLNWVWSRLYKEVKISNIKAVQEIAKTHQLIYLPCHRSHMDYLLLSWALYRHGLTIPHVAAGENLNIPIIGPILKRGGAIFMRRKFHGDPLYACLYKAYLQQMTHRGHSLEYFIEGGRSRTGRLLPAKTGLLSMSIESFREDGNPPVALIPVWIGYDRLVESRSYQKELSGAKKEKESFLNFFSTLNILREKFGRTYLGFAEPISLEEHTDKNRSLSQDVQLIANEVLSRINQTASVPQSSILATCLLAGSQLQSVAELSDKSTRLYNLIKTLNIHTGLMPDEKPSDWIQEAAEMGQLELKMNLVEISEAQTQEMSLYRNNIQHLLILPGMYLLLAHRLQDAKAQSINRTIRMLYPFIQSELFLPWKSKELTSVLKQIREQLIEQNLLQNGPNQSWQTTANPLVNTLILTAEPILLRYYIVIRILERYQEISKTDLIETSQKLAEQIHLEYGYSTPEYKDPNVLASFIKQMQHMDLLTDKEGRLTHNFETKALFKQAGLILRPHLISLIDKKLREE